jgi:hypothetical protein
LREARVEAPVRDVFVLDADERGLGVTADFRGGRFLVGDSPLTPRASKISTSAFPSEGTKMLVYVDECVSGRTSKNRRGSEVNEHTRHGHESEIEVVLGAEPYSLVRSLRVR